MADMMKCPSCDKKMFPWEGNEHEHEKKFYCLECEIKIMVLPNGMTISRRLDEPWESESVKDVS